jgi:hypothetical protein
MKKWTIVLTVAAVTAVAAVGVGVAVRPSSAQPGTPALPRAAPTRYPTASAQYARAVDAVAKTGVRVWIETDLVKRWRAGPASFDEGVGMVADLARHPGVAGIKIADELGYHDGLDSPDKIRAFLTAAGTALHRVAPGKTILVDAIVPELGCLPGYQPPLRWATICAAQARGQYPQLALDQFDGYVHDHLVDAIDLSTGLLGDRTYSGWGVDQQTAQRTAWQEVHRRGWGADVRLQARKALAHPGTYGATDTDQTVATFLDIPRQQGAAAVDVWTWRQLYQGDIYRLLDPGLRTNALWDALLQRRAHGAVLFTHLSPASLEVDLDTDLKVLSTVFTDLFVAAGTG